MIDTSLTDLDLAELGIGAQFTHDEQGRMVAENEPDGDGEPAPRVFVMWTGSGYAWRVRHDVPEEVVQRLEALLASQPVTGDLGSQSVQLDAMLDALRGDPEPQIGYHGPAYRFPATMPATIEVTRISRANLQLLHRVLRSAKIL